jgi:hypothetical protein
MRPLRFAFAIACLVGLLSPEAWAECPPGKTEITIITPSGKTKVLCVPDAALPGIENAAENSDATVIAAKCPCGTTEEFAVTIKQQTEAVTCLVETGPGLGTGVISLNTPTKDRLVFAFLPGSDRVSGKQTCGFDNTSAKTTTDAEAQACVGSIDAAAALFGIACP